MISALDLSSFIIQEAKKEGASITHLKLQKILYYVQGEYLAKYKEPLFPEEIEAWRYGPVVRAVYYKYVSNGALPLKMERENITLNLSIDEMECMQNTI